MRFRNDRRFLISRSLVFGSDSSPTTSGTTAMMIEYQGPTAESVTADATNPAPATPLTFDMSLATPIVLSCRAMLCYALCHSLIDEQCYQGHVDVRSVQIKGISSRSGHCDRVLAAIQLDFGQHRLHLSVVTAEWTSRQHILLKRFPTVFIEASEEFLDFVLHENHL